MCWLGAPSVKVMSLITVPGFRGHLMRSTPLACNVNASLARIITFCPSIQYPFLVASCGAVDRLPATGRVRLQSVL